MKKDFAIIGLGSFGMQLCRELADRGAEIIGIDIDMERVNAVSSFVTFAYCCDSTKRSALEQLKLDEAEKVIVSIGDHLEAMILTIILLEELGVKHIVACAEEESVKHVLEHLGVEEVLNTRALAVGNLTYRLLSTSVTQYVEITSRHSVATLRYAGKEPTATLEEMDLRGKFDLNVLLIRRGSEELLPKKSDRFEPGDLITMFGTQSAIKRMDKKLRA